MRHVRVDGQELNSKRKFACGLGPELPPGDDYVFDGDSQGMLDTVDCVGCGGGRKQLGTPLSELSGRPGHQGYERFRSIAESWGYD